MDCNENYKEEETNEQYKKIN